MIIELNVTIDDGAGVDPEVLASQIENILSEINGQPTDFNIVDMDNPISTNPLNYRVRI